MQWRFVETSAPRRRFRRALEVMAVAVLMCFTIGASVLLRYASDATVDADEAVCGAADDGGAAAAAARRASREPRALSDQCYCASILVRARRRRALRALRAARRST